MSTKLQVLAIAGLGASFAAPSGLAASKNTVAFDMVVSAGASTCLANANASVKITPLDGVEAMDVDVEGLPPNTAFNLFVLQVPQAPFGVSWYRATSRPTREGAGINA